MNNKFHYNTLEELIEDIKTLGLNIPLSKNIEILKKGINIGNKTLPNPIAIHPMEGCDGTSEGEPDYLTKRRYDRFARGGAGLLWVEATAVVDEGRANPRQLSIKESTKNSFRELRDNIIKAAEEEYGLDFKPYTVIQLTHSGRYSKPVSIPEPIIATNNEYLDKFLAKDYRIISDAELELLEDKYVEAAILAKECGFDAVDIKSCHRYLNSELLSAFTRAGKYGGSFENRTRFLLNIIDKIKNKLGDDMDITLRMNAYDAIPYPYGFGVDKEDHHKPNLEEPIKLVKILRDKGIKLINISCGNPYYNPHVGRPYDMGPYIANEHPLQSAEKMLNIVRQIQASVPEVTILATGFTWFREYAANIMAGGIENGWFKMAGVGRQAFAYPDFCKDIILNGGMDRKKCCIACSKCTEIMRDGGKTGCVVRDAEVYGPIYKEGRSGKPSLVGTNVGEHI